MKLGNTTDFVLLFRHKSQVNLKAHREYLYTSPKPYFRWPLPKGRPKRIALVWCLTDRLFVRPSTCTLGHNTDGTTLTLVARLKEIGTR